MTLPQKNVRFSNRMIDVDFVAKDRPYKYYIIR